VASRADIDASTMVGMLTDKASEGGESETRKRTAE
jgi:hypothetical protein